jgi:nucleoside-diphosphate-sugar epimerase
MDRRWWTSKRVLVTGGAGFIGSHLVARLLTTGAELRVVDNLERGREEYLDSALPRIEFRVQDLRSPEVCRASCRDVDVVVHLASKVGGIRYYVEQIGTVFRENTQIDHNMWAAALGSRVPYYFYASSAHVYPRDLQRTPDSPLIREEQVYPADPELSYGWAKLVGEQLVLNDVRQGSSTRASIARIIGSYGPNQSLDLATGSAIPVFCRRAIEYPTKGAFVVLGTGTETRSYHHVSDTVEAILRSVEKLQQCPSVGPFNLGSEERVTIGELVREIISISGKRIGLSWDRTYPTVIWGQALDCGLAARLLDGWKPTVPLREGLRDVFDHIHGRLRGATPAL